MSTRPLVAFGLLSLGLALACSSDEEWVTLEAKEKTAAPTTAEPTFPTAAPTAPGTPGLAGVKERGTLRVAADPDAAPFLQKKADGSFEGFEYGLMSAIASGVGVPVQVVPATFDELVGKLSSGEADLVIGQLSPSAAYSGVAFSTSYLQYSMCLVVGKDSPIAAITDLKGKKVGMYEDPVARQLADTLIGGAYEPVLFDDYGYFEKLARGQLDAMIYDCPLARYEMKTFGDQLKVVDDALNITTYTVGVREGDATMLGEVNKVLIELGNTGVLARLESQWLAGTSAEADFQTRTGKVVVVKRGDTLGEISKRELGSVDRYKELYELNRDVIGVDPNLIYQGMKLRVPG